ncbi:glycine zipper 2TM domain-containing protein [Massilia horti]|nr:glycine zipper 2TM domain-containing protein [Massilia horti]
MDTRTSAPIHGVQHPLMILAAIAVILFSLVGTAAILGWLPSSIGSNATNGQLTLPARPPGAPGAPGTPYVAQDEAPGPATYEPVRPAPLQYPAQAMVSPYVVQPAAPARASARAATRLAANEAAPSACANCGNIESIRAITTRARGSGVGAGAGAVIGGLLGNQIGGGAGRTLATAAGAVGGAVAGNQVEGNMKASTHYEIRVHLDNGTRRTFHWRNAPPWRNGDRVRIVNGSLRSA